MAKRNTKELILITSLELFNELGEPNVSTNRIADEADISPGNLYYHFRSKDDIVIELFKRFVTRLQPLTFLYRNLSDLTSRIPDLDRAMRGLLMRERQAASQIISGLQRTGALRISAVEKESLVDTILLVITYWIPFASVFDAQGLENGSAQIKAIARVLQLVTPFLREPERSQFTSLIYAYLDQAD